MRLLNYLLILLVKRRGQEYYIDTQKNVVNDDSTVEEKQPTDQQCPVDEEVVVDYVVKMAEIPQASILVNYLQKNPVTQAMAERYWIN